MPNGTTNLPKLIASMQPELQPHIYVFAKTNNKTLATSLESIMRFQEPEATTLILRQNIAEKHKLDHEFPCRMITLKIHSSLQAVGFLALITTHLAKHKIAVNPVSGFYHDHLFIAQGQAKQAMKALSELTTNPIS
ncbi:MAG: ACT domain-containing protein [Alphaproteobacteria bacterium]|nr:ACT domain-containing protein [Alphaproteobacteria bacterium]